MLNFIAQEIVVKYTIIPEYMGTGGSISREI
jgi:hypothetical protein